MPSCHHLFYLALLFSSYLQLAFDYIGNQIDECSQVKLNTFCTSGDSIECYQCDSNIDLECSELFDRKSTQLRPIPCDHVYEARFCIKTTGMYEGRIGTIRNCSARDLGDRCSYIKRPGDIRYIRSCVYTCTSDGCNAAVPSTLSTSFLLTFAIFALMISLTNVF